MELITEISTSSDVLISATQINLKLSEEKQTRIVINSALDEGQKELLAFFVSKRNLKLVECPHNVWVIY